MAKVWGETDPFAFAPNEFNFGVLKAVEPFLRIHRNPTAVLEFADDTFKGGKMNREALEACLHYISFHLSEYERSYKEASSELPRHLELVRQVEKFTRPTELEFQSFDDEDERGFEIAFFGPDTQPGAAVELAGDLESPKSFTSSDDQEGLHMDTEAPPQGPDDVLQRGRTNCRAFVYNQAPRRVASAMERISMTPQRCAMVCEFKADEEWEAIAQAAAYARHEILQNLANRHYKPLYLLAFSKFKFTYGVLIAEGQIITGGATVSQAAYDDFVATTEPGRQPSSKAIIDESFKIGTKFYRDNYLSKSRPLYRKQRYIVGDLYIAPEWYTLPSNEVDGGMFTQPARKFYEGLLRIAVGDRILSFSDWDVVCAYAVRMAQSQKQSRHGGANLLRTHMLLGAAQAIAGGLGAVGEFDKRARAEDNDSQDVLSVSKKIISVPATGTCITIANFRVPDAIKMKIKSQKKRKAMRNSKRV